MDLKIFGFFDNEDFIECNILKKFSDEDKAAIVIRSELTSLNDKFDYLYDLAFNTNDNLRKNILTWIDCQKKLVKSLSEVNGGNKFFYIHFDKDCSNCKIYSTLDKALNNSMAEHSGHISLESIDEGGYLGKIFVTHCYSENDDLFDKIAYCSMNKIFDFEIYNRLKELDIFKHVVELKTPFKPFDLVYAPSSCDLYNTFVVIDNSYDNINERKNNKNMFYDKGWLKLNTQNVYLETNPFGSNGVEQGCVLKSFIHEYERCSLNSIKIYKQDELTVNQVNYINEIKNQLNDKEDL